MTPLSQSLARLEPLRQLSSGRREQLAELSFLQQHPLGTHPPILPPEQGALTYLLEGELKVDFADGSSSLLVGGCDRARWPLGAAVEWPRDCLAVTAVEMLRVDRNLLDIMLTWEQLSVVADTAGSSAGEEATLWRTMAGAFSVHTLANGAFSLLPAAHIHELLQRFERIKVKAGEVLIREGEEGDFYFLIESGRCVVRRHVGGVDVVVAELKGGQAFGEEALVAGVKRNATVAMKSDGVLLRLAKPDFEALLKAPLLHRLSRSAAEVRVAAGQATWLDVRYPVEFAQDGLPGAINVPLNEIRSAYGILDAGREYIVYCQSGRRSSAAAFLLAQHGFSACCLEGGLAAFVESSL